MKQMIKWGRFRDGVQGCWQRFHGREVVCLEEWVACGQAGGSFSLEASAVDLDVGQTQCPLSGRAWADVQLGGYSEYQVMAGSPGRVAPVCSLNLSMPCACRGHTIHVQW